MRISPFNLAAIKPRMKTKTDTEVKFSKARESEFSISAVYLNQLPIGVIENENYLLIPNYP